MMILFTTLWIIAFVLIIGFMGVGSYLLLVLSSFGEPRVNWFMLLPLCVGGLLLYILCHYAPFHLSFVAGLT